jgi:hypothetical protein
MIRFLSIVFAFVGGLIGWKIGMVTGLLTAHFGSVLAVGGSSSAAVSEKAYWNSAFSTFASPS